MNVRAVELPVKIEKLARTHIEQPATDELVVQLFEEVRDIPYGTIGSRAPEDVWRMCRGTCSGKHMLLKELFQAVGLEVSECIIMHAFNDMPVRFPHEIRKLLSKEEILDPHNVLRIKRGTDWIDVDATWDSPLETVGFPVNRQWDGRTNMPLCVVERSRLETADSIAAKKELLGEMPKKSQELRKEFLASLTEWLDDVRRKS